MNPHIVLLDNQDSFVYNLVDALAGYRTTVFRNTVPADAVLAARPDLLIASPGPGHPADAGCMMELLGKARDHKIPTLGICLGFQALLHLHGGDVRRCGPVHGKSLPMDLTSEGLKHPVFTGAGPQVPVARYHSLGCTEAPPGMRCLATAPTAIGDVVMAAETDDGQALGLQFHPESILTPSGPLMIERIIDRLTQGETHEH